MHSPSALSLTLMHLRKTQQWVWQIEWKASQELPLWNAESQFECQQERHGMQASKSSTLRKWGQHIVYPWLTACVSSCRRMPHLGGFFYFALIFCYFRPQDSPSLLPMLHKSEAKAAQTHDSMNIQILLRKFPNLYEKNLHSLTIRVEKVQQQYKIT